MTIIIPKPNKALYNIPKMLRIILLNILGKLIEKLIRERLQFQALSKNLIYSCQLEGLKQYSTVNVEIVLIYLIHVEWVKKYTTSTLVFNMAQFFLLLNHQLLPLILNKVKFYPRVSHFFGNYLVGRKTRYFWNNFSSPFFDVNIGIRQGSALPSILLALYLSPIFHIFEKNLKS